MEFAECSGLTDIVVEGDSRQVASFSASTVADKLANYGLRGPGLNAWKVRLPDWLLSEIIFLFDVFDCVVINKIPIVLAKKKKERETSLKREIILLYQSKIKLMLASDNYPLGKQ